MDNSLESYSIVCTICARGGSKGVPGKNVRDLHGRPLIAHTIEQAKASGIFSKIAVSSDSADILNISEAYGADYLIERPDDMATDRAAKLPVIQHCFQQAEERAQTRFDIGIDLDATAPLRLPDDIIGCARLLIERAPCTVITAMPSRRSPYFNMVELMQDGYVQLAKTLDSSVQRRQDTPVTYDMNASIYAWMRDDLLNATKVIGQRTRVYEMPEERSIDIDAPLDWEFVEFLLSKRNT